ncbi:MAG TPA: hypothetical protein VNT22_10750 [Baekduia sp.]|nr:hypothetical protein [Baekduia sp.]
MALPAAAHAQAGQQSPALTPDLSLKAKPGSGGRLALTFTGRSRRLLRFVKGKQIYVRCSVVPSTNLLADPPLTSTRRVKKPHGSRLKLRFKALARYDFCMVYSLRQGAFAFVSLTDHGRTYVDYNLRALEIAAALAMIYGESSATGKPPLTDVAVSRLKPLIVALPTRDAVPPRGQIGYWSDGSAIALAAVAADGTRLFYTLDGGSIETQNISQYLAFDAS